MTVTGHQQRDISTQRLFITLGEIILKLFSKNYYMLHPHFYHIFWMRNCVSDVVLWVRIGFNSDPRLDPDPALTSLLIRMVDLDPVQTFKSRTVELFKSKISRTLCICSRLVGH
jgi:hypothetical protein